MINKNHKYTWTIPEGADTNDIIVCENCGVDYDEWYEKMSKKGYDRIEMSKQTITENDIDELIDFPENAAYFCQRCGREIQDKNCILCDRCKEEMKK